MCVPHVCQGYETKWEPNVHQGQSDCKADVMLEMLAWTP
jgi:hypothetical protein